jgi:predicted DNA-binding transcriptional regulator AlpA
MKTFPSGKLMSIEDVAILFGVHRKTIDRWCRERDDFPKKIVIGTGSVRFLTDEIDNFLLDAIAKSRSA